FSLRKIGRRGNVASCFCPCGEKKSRFPSPNNTRFLLPATSLRLLLPTRMRRSCRRCRGFVTSDEKEAASHLRHLAREGGHRSGSSRESGARSSDQYWIQPHPYCEVKNSMVLLIKY
ncbi:unnamed protein product, partial [Musa acuminata var. zebrina]